MKKAFVYKLRLSPVQEAKLSETLETCRHLYNHAVGDRKETWEQEQRSVGFAAQSATLPTLKQTNPYLPQVHSQVLQDVLHRVDRAFQAFFRRVKAGEKPGYPRCRGRGRNKSDVLGLWRAGPEEAVRTVALLSVLRVVAPSGP